MKKIISFILVLYITNTVVGQSSTNLFPKTISVSGSAAMEVTPDEIYVNITLTEYQKKGESKKDLETIKTQFLGVCKALGIHDSLISIASYGGNGNYYTLKKKKKDSELMAQITYQVKFKSSKTMDELIEKLDDNATRDFKIATITHSKIIEFRKQLKIQAVKEAKIKAEYLAEAAGEKIGVAITIEEPEERSWTTAYGANSLSSQRITYNDEYRSSSEIDFKSLRLRYEVSVTFELK